MKDSAQVYRVPSPLQAISFDWAAKRNLKFFVKRDDLIHEAVSGNKWRKLKFNILQARHLDKKGILTFGGAYSNHILATAHASMNLGLKSIAFIRGDELNKTSNSIVQQCSEWGMDLKFVSREEYRMKDDWDYIQELKSEFHEYFVVPEGGKSFLGIVGCQEITKEMNEPFDAIWTAAGTSTTSIGLAMSVNSTQEVHVVPVLEGFNTSQEICTILKSQGIGQDTIEDVLSRMIFHPNSAFGGYGKTNPELLEFILQMKKDINLPLDPVYTGKSFYSMLDFYKHNEESNKTIVFLHTGGLRAGASLLHS